MRVEAVSKGDAGLVLERESELARIEALVRDLSAGQGQMLALEGAGGIGKTTLLAQARAAAREDGVLVLGARASELEREFAFGVIRQWFEPLLRAAPAQERARLLSGPAGLAESVLLDVPAVASEAPVFDGRSEAGERALYGLYWLLATLTESTPALLAVDDAQWADQSSLRFLNFIAARLDGLPVALIVGSRPPDPGEHGMLLARLLADPGCAVIRPAPLSPDAAATLISRRLRRVPDERFLAACHEATGGNPFYLEQLADALEQEALSPTDDHLARVAELRPPDLPRAILPRLTPNARRLVQALAILGGPSEPSVVGAVCGLERSTTAASAAELARAGLITDGRPLEFVHPIVQSALLASLPGTERARLHALAAAALRAHGAGAEHVAVHLLEAEPGSDPAAFDTLRAAGRLAMARGAPQVAVTLLRRAELEAPGAGPQLAELLLALGSAESEAALPGASEHHRRALHLAEDPILRARVVLVLGWSGGPGAPPDDYIVAVDQAAESVRQLDRELALELESMGLLVLFLAGDRAEMGQRADRMRALPGETPAEVALLAVVARYDLDRGAPAPELAVTVRRALACPDALRVHGPSSAWLLNLGVVLNHLECFDDNEALLERAVAVAQDRGSASGFAVALTHLAKAWLLRGDLRQAETRAAQALASQGAQGWYRRAVAAVLIQTLVERGRLEEAQAAYDATGVGEDMPDVRPATPLLIARGMLRHARGDLVRAFADLLEARARIDRYQSANIVGLDARLMLVSIHHQREELDEARAAADGCVRVALAWGTPGAVGQALRAQARLVAPDAGIALLRRSVDSLAASQMRLEHARSLIELGAALRRGGARTDSREPLREGLTAAERAGAEPLAERAWQELAQSGVTVRRNAHRHELTPSEQRIAEMAAGGSTNRQIAQELFVTVKTVESHLAGAYRKLEISTRRELPVALANLNGG